MDPLVRLDRTLHLARDVLDEAASQVRDADLSPTRTHIESIGRALARIFEIQRAIYQVRPDLEKRDAEPPAEVRDGNRRLGEALIEAYELADNGNVSGAIRRLEAFADNEPSEFHKALAEGARARLASRHDA